MKRLDLHFPTGDVSEKVSADVILDEGDAKVRRIVLKRGGRIPPCRMEEDVVFVVLSGRVIFRSDGVEEEVLAQGAVYIPKTDETRSMEAVEPSRVLAVLCRGAK